MATKKTSKKTSKKRSSAKKASAKKASAKKAPAKRLPPLRSQAEIDAFAARVAKQRGLTIEEAKRYMMSVAVGRMQALMTYAGG